MASKFSHLPDIRTIQPDRLIKYRVSEDRFSAEVLLPGFSYTDFDQKIGGKVGLWSFGKVLESVRSIAMAAGFIYFRDLLYKPNRTLFVGGHSFTLSKDFHDLRYSNVFGRKKLLKSVLYICDVGKSSYTVATDLYDFKSGIKICSYKTIQVFVDRQLRKPVPLPPELFIGLDSHLQSVKRQKIKRLKTLAIPLNVFQYKIKALHSDSDANHHVNQATYLKWCLDASSVGSLKGHFSYFKRQIELYPLKSAEYHYIGETLVNDVVTVNVWEDDVIHDKILRFAITINDRVIFILRFEFYDRKPLEVLPHLESKL